MRIRDLSRDRVVWLFVAVVLVYFIRPLTGETFYFRDLSLLFYPKKLFFAEAIRGGVLPLWDPLTNGGRPYLATPTHIPLHPSNLLYLLLPVLAAFNVILVLHVLFCAVAAYWLARVLRMSEAAAAITGFAFAFCGCTLSAANVAPILFALPWIPMTIGLTHRALREGRSIAPAALAAAMPLYSASVEVTALLFVLLAVWLIAAPAPAAPRRRVLAFALVAVFAAALSLLQTLPALSVIEQSERREKRTYESFSGWSVSPLRLPELLVPRFFGDTDRISEGAYWGREHETLGYPYILSLYFGVPLLLLAAAGAFSGRAGNDVPPRAMAAVAVTAIVLSLGSNLPFWRLVYDHVPLVTTFRYPVKAQSLALLPIALLAGCGWERLRSDAQMGKRFAMAALLIAIAAAIAAWRVEAGGSLDDQAREVLVRGLAQTMFFAAAVGAALMMSARAGWVAHVALPALIAVDLLLAGQHVNDYAPRAIFDTPPLARRVKEMIGPHRFYSSARPPGVIAPDDDQMWVARWQLATLDGYYATTFGIPVIFHTDYDGLAPLRVVNLGRAGERLPWERRRALLDRGAVAAFITPAQVQLPDVQEIARLDAPHRPLRLYANARAVAARFVSSVELAADDADALRRLLATPPLERAVVEERAPAGNCGTAPIRVVRRGINTSSYQVDAPCAGLVVFSEPHYAGWIATVDGREVPHIRADYAFTAVPVAGGRHTIERRYRPPLLLAGAAGTIVAALLLGFAARSFRRAAATS